MDAPARKPRGRPRGPASEREGGSVQTLERALALLTSLARTDKATLSDLALRTGMPPSSAHRLLMTLQAGRFVEFDETTAEWAVGIEVFRVGASFLRRISVTDAARDKMRALVAQTGETANLGIADGGEVVFVGQMESTQPIRAFFAAGVRAPMHSSGIGKALMAAMPCDRVEKLLQRTGLPGFTPHTLTAPADLFADLERIRARGWALDDEERHEGMRCVASAIFNLHGEVVAGISISGPTVRLGADRVGEIGPLMRRAASDVTERIGGIVPTDWGKA
ncbi:MAG: IclR family transcriptional regulator [Rhodobacteraceae bacterium]|nr:IclR family transcriptional regulator [Paracoccaceae bacterium]